jgi:hypothetical protein
MTANPSYCALWQNWWQNRSTLVISLPSHLRWLSDPPSRLGVKFCPPHCSPASPNFRWGVNSPWVACQLSTFLIGSVFDMFGIWYVWYLLCLISEVVYLISSVSDKFIIWFDRHLMCLIYVQYLKSSFSDIFAIWYIYFRYLICFMTDNLGIRYVRN